MGCNLVINGKYWGYNPLTNHLLTSWDIQVPGRSSWWFTNQPQLPGLPGLPGSPDASWWRFHQPIRKICESVKFGS